MIVTPSIVGCEQVHLLSLIYACRLLVSQRRSSPPELAPHDDTCMKSDAECHDVFSGKVCFRFQHSLSVVECSCSCFFSAPAACADNEVLLKIRYAMTVSHKLYIFAKHVSCFSSPAFSLLVEARHPFVNFNYDKSILCSCVVVH